MSNRMEGTAGERGEGLGDELLMRVRRLEEVIYRLKTVMRPYDKTSLISEVESVFSILSYLESEVSLILDQVASLDITSDTARAAIIGQITEFFESAGKLKAEFDRKLGAFVGAIAVIAQKALAISIFQQFSPFPLPYFTGNLPAKAENRKITQELAAISFVSGETHKTAINNRDYSSHFQHFTDEILKTKRILTEKSLIYCFVEYKNTQIEVEKIEKEEKDTKSKGKEEIFSDKQLMEGKVNLGEKFLEGKLALQPKIEQKNNDILTVFQPGSKKTFQESFQSSSSLSSFFRSFD